MLRAVRDHDISQRRACVLIGVDPKTVRRERPPDNAEIRELRQGEEGQKTVRGTVFPTNEILRKASAYFAMAEFDRGSM